MLTIRPLPALVALLLFCALHGAVDAVPQRGRQRQRERNGGMTKGMTSGQDLTAQEQAAQVPDGISQATDGSTILDMTVNVKLVLLGTSPGSPETNIPQ